MNDMAILVGNKIEDQISYLGAEAVLNEQALAKVAQNIKVSEMDSSYAYIVAADSTMMYHPSADKIGKPVENAAVKQLLVEIGNGNRPETDIIIYDFKGVTKYASYFIGANLCFRCKAEKIKVLAVPVIANYAGNVVACEGEWKTVIQFTKDTYPIAKDGIEYVLGSELDLSDSMYDLTTDEGQYNVWAALCTLQTPGNDYELILGFVRDRQGADGTTQGYTYGSPASECKFCNY